MNILTELSESFRLKGLMKDKEVEGTTGIDLYYIMVGEVDNAEISEETKENIMKDIKKELGIK